MPIPDHVIAAARINHERLQHHRDGLRAALIADEIEGAFVPFDLGVSLRVWCHHTAADGGQSHSLLEQLGATQSKCPDGTPALNSGVLRGALASVHGRAHANRPFIPSQLRFISPLQDSAPLVSFEDWWVAEALALKVRGEASHRTLTRKQLVSMWANKFGGAHVDPDEPDVFSWSTVDGLGGHLWVSPMPPAPGKGRTLETVVAPDRPSPRYMRLPGNAAWSLAAAVLERVASEFLVALNGNDRLRKLGVVQ